MGVIARQGIKRSILSLTGSMIGVISLLVIYPLSKEAYGFAQYLISSAVLISMFLSFGSSSLVIRYFPELNEKFGKGFLTIIFSITFFVIVLSTSILSLFKNEVLRFMGKLDFNIKLIHDNLLVIFMLAVLLIIIQILINQSSNFRRIVIPFAIHELSFKIFLPILILLFYLGKIGLYEIGLGLLFFYFFSLILNAIYLRYIGGFSIGKTFFWILPKAKLKQIFNYMGFSGLNIIGENITTQIDRIMIPLLLTMGSNGIYSIFLFMSNTVIIPVVSLYPIAAPIISDSIQKGDMKNVENIYKKTSLNSLIAGSFIFIVLWLNIKDIVTLMPNKDQILPFVNVFLFLCLARLFDMLTSVNTYILIYSKFYKYNLIFLICLALMNILFNYFLINLYGIVGAAMGTMLSLFIYNLIKLIFIQLKFKMNPFSKHTFSLFIILTFLLLVGYFLPNTQVLLVNLIYKSLVITALYYLLIKLFKIKSELITTGESLMGKIGLYFKNKVN